MFRSNEYVNEAIILFMFLENIVASLTLLYWIILWTFDLRAIFWEIQAK